MLREQLWFDFCDDLPIEIEQRIDEGILEAERFKERAEQVKEMPRGAARTAAGAELLEQLCALENPQDKDEPSDLPGIKAASVGEPKEKAEADCDKIYGAWLGRCAGCLLGQPVEGWRRARINGLLKETGNLPLQNYISSDIGPVLREKYNVRDDGHAYGAEKTGWINNVSYMPEDDDTNYTLIALKLVEQYGRDFTPDDAAENWLMNLPLLHLCTAERVAYINLAQSVFPPESALYRNPYREWIGAQIRGDYFGYINPGDPELAAEMAWRDASISHVKNGIYGEMFVAAMLAAAAVNEDIVQVIEAGLSEIPETSRLYEAIQKILAMYSNGASEEAVFAEIHRQYDEYTPHGWCHTIPNAMIVAAALLYGHGDYGRTICMAVQTGFDTDCNGATAGSVLGMIKGIDSIPEYWKEPMHDMLHTSIFQVGTIRISDGVKKTLEHIHMLHNQK